MLKICNLREGLLVALMSIGTLTAEAAVDPEKFNDAKDSNYSKTEEEDLDLISKFELEWQLFDLKTQKSFYQTIDLHLSVIQKLCVSETIETIEEMCKIPSGLLSGLMAGWHGLATLNFIKLFYQEYTLTEVKKNFVLYRDNFRGPLTVAIEQLESLNRRNGINFYNLNNMPIDTPATRMRSFSRILRTMDQEIREILKITQREYFANAMQVVERLIDRTPKLSKIQIHTSKIKTPSPYNYLNFLDANIQKMVRATAESRFNGTPSEKIIDVSLKKLREKGLSTDSAWKIRLTRYNYLVNRFAGVLVFGGVTLFLLDDASILLSPGPISSQLDELRNEIDEIQVEIDQLEELKDIAL